MSLVSNNQPVGPAPHNVTFRAMRVDDIEEICLIEIACFPTPWTADAFLNELEHNTFAKYIVMTWNDTIIGYAGMWTILDEAHITNIAVLEQYRGLKLGERLLRELVVLAMSCGMKRMTLEVRTTNYTAQRLYEKLGFRAEGLRRGYYSDNGEDAIIMWAELPWHLADGEA